MARYVPKTYNNKRLLRIIIWTAAVAAILFLVLFLILFFVLQGFVVEGRLEHPWMTEGSDTPIATPTPEPTPPDEEYYP